MLRRSLPPMTSPIIAQDINRLTESKWYNFFQQIIIEIEALKKQEIKELKQEIEALKLRITSLGG